MLMCEAGERIPYPSGDSLFIEDQVYSAGFEEETSISGYYCSSRSGGSAGTMPVWASPRTCGQRLDSRDARRNVMHYAKTAEQLFGSAS